MPKSKCFCYIFENFEDVDEFLDILRWPYLQVIHEKCINKLCFGILLLSLEL